MKRHLLAFTALSMKRVAFTILCCTVLMLFAAPAWAQGDQCSGALPVGSATGCGAVITVFTVDNTAAASSFTVTATGNGNPYDGTEDTLVGIQNSSGQNLTSITLSSPDTTFGGLFNFDGDGPCGYPAGGTHDCFNGAQFRVDPGDYQGPNNIFSAISSDHTSGTVTFNAPIPDGGSTWFALEGTPQSIGGGKTLTKTLTQTTTVFDFTPDVVDPTKKTKQTIDYTNAGATFPTDGDVQMQVTFLPISDYSNLVAGTFAQGSKCMPQDTGGGNFRCAGTIVLCKGPHDMSFAGANCPAGQGTGFISVAEKYQTNAFTLPTDVPSPGYLQAKDNALSCNGTTDTNNSCRGLVKMLNVTIADDCCTTSGSPPQHFNSLFVPIYCLGFNIISVDEFNVPGFASPVDNPGPNLSAPVVNLINSKQAVPIKLTVGALPAACTGGAPFTNLDLVGSTNPATIHSVVLTATNATVCNGSATYDPTPTTIAAGNSGWQILGNGMYQFNWKPAAPVGSCLAFSVNIGDGVQHTAYFKITK